MYVYIYVCDTQNYMSRCMSIYHKPTSQPSDVNCGACIVAFISPGVEGFAPPAVYFGGQWGMQDGG
jgi:hypothetical protein